MRVMRTSPLARPSGEGPHDGGSPACAFACEPQEAPPPSRCVTLGSTRKRSSKGQHVQEFWHQPGDGLAASQDRTRQVIRIPLNYATIGKAPLVAPYRETRYLSRSLRSDFRFTCKPFNRSPYHTVEKSQVDFCCAPSRRTKTMVPTATRASNPTHKIQNAGVLAMT